MEIKREGWLARDLQRGFSGGDVYLYTEKPRRDNQGNFTSSGGQAFYVGGPNDLKEITWGESPVKVSMTITMGAPE